MYVCIYTYIYTYIYTHTYIYKVIKKEWNLAICDNMDGPWGHYAKWNKSAKERQIPYDLIYMQNLNQKQKHKLINTEKMLPEAGGGEWAKCMKVDKRYKLPVKK